MVRIIRGTTKKPVSSQRLADLFASYKDCDGYLYIGYPIIGTAEGAYPIDALLISPSKGLIIFNLVEGCDVDAFQDSQDDSYNKLESKLRAQKSLMAGRALQVTIYPVTFAPAIDNVENISGEEYPVCNELNLGTWLDTCSWSTPGCYENLVAVIQAISTIRKGRKKRDVQKDDSRGAKLKRLEDSIANLDNLQGRAVIETVEGVQRIRGLAGSGKTIVLALKAAYLHAQHPDWKIAVTFNTRSLKGQFRQLINTFIIEQTNEEPDWGNIHILHAWGSPGGGEKNGIYYNFCQINEIEYHDFNGAKRKFGQDKAFEGACQQALNECTGCADIYDVIIVDEAQDFSPVFLQMCYELLTPVKRLIYAYDDLQNLNSSSLPSPEEIFGKHTDGTPKVKFVSNQRDVPQQDIILEKCYRNSRPVLVTAHALGFGIYKQPAADTGTNLVQIFGHSQLWIEVGYEVINGTLKDGSPVTLGRSQDSSPLFLEDHSPIEDLIQFHSFNSREEQNKWVADEIKRNLDYDELRPDDIIVINPDPLSTRKVVGPIRQCLFEQNINSHLVGVDTSPDVFFDAESQSITFTGIYRAKGNEAGMVYVINAQDCYSSYVNMAGIRNRLFTAITRSKAWVRVLGVGKNMELLKQEFEEVKQNQFQLNFRYPTKQERETINIVNRDMTAKELSMIRKKKSDLEQLLNDLEERRIYPEDIGAEQLERLSALLNKNSK